MTCTLCDKPAEPREVLCSECLINADWALDPETMRKHFKESVPIKDVLAHLDENPVVCRLCKQPSFTTSPKSQGGLCRDCRDRYVSPWDDSDEYQESEYQADEDDYYKLRGYR